MIRTVSVKLDTNPAQWLSDQRVQELLPAEHVLAYVNLCCHAMQSTATTGSDYVDGQFSFDHAVKRVRHVTTESIAAMMDADLVAQVDEDRWQVEFITAQTTHEFLQSRADQLESLAQARRDKSNAKGMEKAKAEHKRRVDRDRQRKHRAKAAEPITYTADERQPPGDLDGNTDVPDWFPPPTPQARELCPTCFEPTTSDDVLHDGDRYHHGCYRLAYDKSPVGV